MKIKNFEIGKDRKYVDGYVRLFTKAGLYTDHSKNISNDNK